MDSSTLSQLNDIIEYDRIKTVFQPIISLRDGILLGYECFARIAGKGESAFKSITDLFDAACRYGRLWDLEILCRTKALESANMQSFPQNKKLFINVHPDLMQDLKFKEGFTKKYLDNFSLKPENIVAETSEKAALNGIEDFKALLCHYKEQGYRISIDCAGSGYAGLNLICDIGPDYIKLDMNLIRNIGSDKIKYTLAKNLVELSRLINKRTIALGIETEDEMLALIDLGVQYGQGYFIGIPNEKILPPSQEVIDFIRDANQKKNHKFGNLLSNIYIGNLCRNSATIKSSVLVEEVYNMFFKSKDLLCISVIENETAIGVITRAKLSQLVCGQYGYSLYQKKPVTRVMDDDFLEVDFQMPISSAARLAMSRISEKLYDPIIVSKEGKYLGIVTIKDLLEKTTEIEVINAKHQNPLSGLPGNAIIEQNILQCLKSGSPFCAMYLDLDNFKAYNDVYGFENGDLVIKLLAGLIEKHTPPDGFKGHIGGDDFIIIIYDYSCEKICENIITDFDREIKKYYSAEDVDRGYIETKNRRGETEKFPLVSLSIAVINNRTEHFPDIYSFSEKLAIVKKMAKKAGRSNYCIL